MNKRNTSLLILGLIVCGLGFVAVMNTALGQISDHKKNIEPVSSDDAETYLVSLWTSGDPEVAEKVCFMYTHHAKKQGWFDHVNLIVWGPSSKLLAENTALQSLVRALAKDGVKLQACKACADLYGVSDDLESLGIEVKYMGLPLSNMLKQGRKVLTF